MRSVSWLSSTRAFHISLSGAPGGNPLQHTLAPREPAALHSDGFCLVWGKITKEVNCFRKLQLHSQVSQTHRDKCLTCSGIGDEMANIPASYLGPRRQKERNNDRGVDHQLKPPTWFHVLGANVNRDRAIFTPAQVLASPLPFYSTLSSPLLHLPSLSPSLPLPLLPSMNICYFFPCKYGYNSSTHILPHVTRVNTEFLYWCLTGWAVGSLPLRPGWCWASHLSSLCSAASSFYMNSGSMTTGQSEGSQGLLTYLLGGKGDRESR